MRSIFDQGPPDPPPAVFNLAAYVLGAGATTPDKIALAVLGLSGAERWSFARLTEAVLGTATGLLREGLEPGDRVLLRLGNTVDFPVAYLGAIAAGLVAIPTSAALTTPEVDTVCRIARPRLIIAAPGLALPGDAPCPVLPLETLATFRSLPPADYAMGEPDRLAYILFTSGTTGVPRAVAHAHRAIWARRMMHDGWYGLTPEDRLLHAGAFNWSYTLGTGLMDPWSVGATALIPAEGIAADALPLLLKRHDATIFAAVPGVYRRLLRADVPALPKLRHGLSAGEKLPEATRDAWRAATGTEIYEAYGMSECSTFISGSPARPAPPDSLGYPQQGRRIAILHEDGTVCDHGAPGRISIGARDPGLMLGYLDGDTLEAPEGDWYVTSDLGSMGADGAIRYEGRADDMMNAGGYRVSPLEVEAAIHDHPDAGEVAAVEVPVKADTTVIALFYTGPATVETLRAFAAERLASYKQPRLYVHRESLPKGANGKLLRRALRDAPLDPAG